MLVDYEAETLNKMWQAITVIEAQEQLKLLNALDWPNMKKENRTKLHKELSKLAYPDSKVKKSITTKDLSKLLGGRNG